MSDVTQNKTSINIGKTHIEFYEVPFGVLWSLVKQIDSSTDPNKQSKKTKSLSHEERLEDFFEKINPHFHEKVCNLSAKEFFNLFMDSTPSQMIKVYEKFEEANKGFLSIAVYPWRYFGISLMIDKFKMTVRGHLARYIHTFLQPDTVMESFLTQDIPLSKISSLDNSNLTQEETESKQPA